MNPVTTPGFYQGKFVIQEDIDPGSPTFRFPCGILGLKVDDVDNDGIPEIWCGDARGQLWCLQQEQNPPGPYRAIYRSESLGTYPGLYNNIYPTKNAQGETSGLLVFSSGYVYRFAVNGGGS